MCQARHTPERAPNHHRASSHARASANAGLVPYVATHLPFATSESDDAGGLNTAVTVARDALLLLWHGYADRRRGDRPAPRFEVARGPGAETLTALPLASCEARVDNEDGAVDCSTYVRDAQLGGS